MSWILAGTATIAALMIIATGCSTNGHPMRMKPGRDGHATPKGKSWLITGTSTNQQPFSCSFVEFDERGDFLDFDQHTSSQETIKELAASNRVLIVLYCHGWKNSSQSGDVIEFNAFLAKLAASEEIQSRGLRVHGVYLGWRGNSFRPYVNKGVDNDLYQASIRAFGEPIVDGEHHRKSYWVGAIPETLSYWNRRRAAEHKVSGLPMARAIFTYAAAAKDYGRKLDNRVFVIGHSFGALMLEQSLGQAMTGALTLEWWDGLAEKAKIHPGLPFDMVLFVNSAAPAIYAKQMRDFLKAHRSALARVKDSKNDVPVIISLTSTGDKATGVVHPIGNVLSPLLPSLKRRYYTGIFGEKKSGGAYPIHDPIRQSDFYTKTPGHHPYLINHWIVTNSTTLPADISPGAIFSSNLSPDVKDPDVFFTSAAKNPAAAWKLTTENPGKPVTLNNMAPAMADSDYWIISCGKEIIENHNDIWSTTTMETYVALFRAAESRRKAK